MIGKVGTVVGIVDKFGRSFYRAADVIPNDPKTPAQLRHRFKMGTVSKLSRTLAQSLNETMFYHGVQMKTTPRNAFIKANMDKFLDEPLRFDYANLVLGYGRLAKPLVSVLDAATDAPRIKVELPDVDMQYPAFRVALCLLCEAASEAKSYMVEMDGLYKVYEIPQGWLETGYYLYAVTVNMNMGATWLPSQYTSGGRIMQAHETSDTTTIAIS